MRFVKVLSLLVCMLAGLTLTAQAQEIETPNYQHIKTTISNSKHPSYFPRLMERFVAADSTLTLEDFRNLYYGYTLREDFVPYQSETKQLLDMRNKLIRAAGNADICKEAIAVAQEVLDDNPFDLPALSIIAIASLQLDDKEAYEKWSTKLDGVMDAITSSGDGETIETAFHVINIEHEYEVLHRMGLKLVADSLVNNKVEYLRVEENAEGIRGLYFNFGACSSVYKKKYE